MEDRGVNNCTEMNDKNYRLTTTELCYKIFYGCNLQISVINCSVFVPGKPYQPSLMFAS